MNYPVPYNVRCPRCGAARGAQCVTRAGKERDPHERRLAKAGIAPEERRSRSSSIESSGHRTE
ncbi:zinc finger domain-containing protein [Microvirga massiliensis]|uniref:zinc finger domain-containing protein n=1 Tax=Microvirga massiliensis TaxID=1033741 RepID=UPI003CC7CF7C